MPVDESFEFSGQEEVRVADSVHEEQAACALQRLDVSFS
jgi:hypothetical protein